MVGNGTYGQVFKVQDSFVVFLVSKMFPDSLQVLEEQNPVDQSKQDLRMWTILPGGNLWITQNHLASRVDWLDQSN